MPPALQEVLRQPWVGEAVVDASDSEVPSSRNLGEASLGQLVARQPRFRFVPDAATGAATPRIVPETAAAERLARDPRAAGLLDVLRGVAQLEPEARITGIALSTSNNGAAANTVLNDLEAGFGVPRGASQDDVEAFDEFVSGASMLRSVGLGSEYDLASGWILLGPEHSRQLLQTVGAPVRPGQRNVIDGEQGVPDAHVAAHAAVVLAHEAAHAVTPPTSEEFARGAWLEEATANLMVNLPSTRERILETMGVDVGPLGRQAWHRRDDATSLTGDVATMQRSVRDHYPHETALLTKVLKRGGLDVRRAADEARVRELLQGAAPGEVPGRIAREIGQAHGLGESSVVQLAELIQGGDAAMLGEIDAAVGQGRAAN